MTVRPAVAADVPAMAAILVANNEAMDWPDLPQLGCPYLDHLVRRSRAVVAETNGAIVGFGASVAVRTERIRFLTDLFIEPGVQSRGNGGALLDAALAGSDHRMTFSSGDPRALALYIRAGMRPWWPLLYLEVPAARSSRDDAGLEVGPADVAETSEWSRAWTGVDRSVDFAHYGSLPDARGFVIRDAGAVAAVGWARRERRRSDGRWLDHASLAPDADPVRIGLTLIRAAASGGRLMAPVTGPHPVVAAPPGGRGADPRPRSVLRD